MEHLAATPSFIGIDISKDRLDVHVVPSGWTFTARRDDKGLEQLVGDLRQLAPTLVVLEATGGFEITVAAALASANLPLAVINPRQIRDFARATGRLAKPTSSMPRSLLCSPSAFDRSRAHWPTPTARAWQNWSHAVARWWR